MQARIASHGLTALSFSLALVACRAADSRSRARAASVAEAASPAPAVDSNASSRRVAGLVAPDVHAVCDSVFIAWHANPHVTVVSADTTALPMSSDGSVGSAEPACAVSAELDSVAEADTSRTGKGYWSNTHWTMLPHLGADGAGSEMVVMQRAVVRCEVTHISDADDDDDPADTATKGTPAAAPGEIEWTLCYRAAPIGVRDTSDAPPSAAIGKPPVTGAIVQRARPAHPPL